MNQANISVFPEKVRFPLNEEMYGVFYEEINHAGDGGLYAELIQNRDFEYSPKDGNKDKDWNSMYAWSVQGNNAIFTIGTDHPIHANNPHYAILYIQEPGASLVNEGYGGIVVRKGEKYDFSMFSKIMNGKKGGKTVIRLMSKDGKELARTTLSVSSRDWRKQTAVYRRKWKENMLWI